MPCALTRLFRSTFAIVAAVALAVWFASFADAETLDATVNAAMPEQFEALRDKAEKLARTATGKRDEDVYYATLMEGLRRLLRQDGQDGMRGGATDASASIETLTAEDPRPGITDDPRLRMQLEKLLEEGLSGKVSVRIRNGTPALMGEFTETVALLDAEGDACSGTVIGEDAVLTAAHCVCALDLEPPGLSGAQVLFGDPKVFSAGSPISSRPIDAPRTKLPPWNGPGSFCSEFAATRICGGDIAVVYFDGGLPDHVDVAIVAKDNTLLQRSSSIVAGYGDTTNRSRPHGRVARWIGAAAPKKNFGILGLAINCSSALKNCTSGGSKHGCLPDLEIVVPGSASNTTDTCTGDSGGPLFVPRDRDTQPWPDWIVGPKIVAGVTSRALAASGKCGPGGIYTSVFSEESKAFLADVLD